MDRFICRKCDNECIIESHYNFGEKKHPIFHCEICLNFYTRIGNVLISSEGMKDERGRDLESKVKSL